MRDLVVREGLGAMAADAAERLRELLAAGEELPYEVHESGDGSPLCRYEPLTERFVHEHAAELRRLDSFGSASAALENTGLAGPYLERMGIPVPEDPRRRAELAGVAFLCRLWMNSSDFSLDEDRLEAAIDEVEAGDEPSVGEIEVIVPLRGLQLPTARLDLDGVTVVRADTVDVPAEAQAGDLRGASPWEPAFLAVVRVPDPTFAEDDADAGAVAVDAFRHLITTLRLFKAGGVGLGPHAWTRIGGDRWRRIATGAGRPRPGGYRLAETELGPLVALARALVSPASAFARRPGDRRGLPTALRRAISRFEAGLERNVVIEALNDHLLALRFVLEGGGPASLGLSIRVAALCAEPDRRDEVKAVVDRAIGLERELWSGEPALGGGATPPAETAAALEELARAILKDAACGHLGTNLRVTADEILLADGLAVGDEAEQRGATAEWSPASTDADVFDEEEEVEDLDQPIPVEVGHDDPELIDELSRLDETLQDSALDRRITPEFADPDIPGREAEEMSGVDSEEAEQMRLSPAEAQVRAEIAALETRALRLEELPAEDEPEPEPVSSRRGADGSPVLRLIEQTRVEREARSARVAELFPAPETTEWDIREVAYDRSRRAVIRHDPEPQQAS